VNTAEFPRPLARLVRLPQLTDADLGPDATMFAHARRLPPVPPARPRPTAGDQS